MKTTMKTTMKTIGLAAVTALTLVGCGGGGGGSDYTPHPYDAPPISETLKAQYLNTVNQARSVGRTCGELGYFPPAPPLTWSDALYKSAYEHSEDMATVDVLSHDGSGTNSDWTANVQELGRGSTVAERAINNGATEITDENAGYGSTSLSVLMDAWLKSDGHCAGVMYDRAKNLGMARVGLYWSMELEEI